MRLEDPKCQRTLGYRKDRPKLGVRGRRKVESIGNMEITAALGTHIPQLRVSVAAVWLLEVSMSSEGLRW